jgi:hypothetical protein
MSREKLLARHRLANGLSLELWDRSRPVAGDRWQVVLEARIAVPVVAATLPPELLPEADAVQGALGPEVVFSHRDERNFIAASAIPDILEEMQTRLLALVPDYLGHPDFARRFIRIKYAEHREKQSWQRP